VSLRNWKIIVSIALVAAIGACAFVLTAGMHLLKNGVAAAAIGENADIGNTLLFPDALLSALPTPTAPALENSDVNDSSPYPYFYPDTEVLVYTGQGGVTWQPLPFAMVPRGGEFQFDGYLCGIDQDGRVWVSPNMSATQLFEADRNFDPYNWRWPESEDVVRFVDRDNHHLRHDRMGRFQAGDRFWFQGILWEAFADPDSPTGVSYWQTAFVQNEDGKAVLVDGYSARGALNEGAYSQAGYTLPSDVATASTNSPSDPPAMESLAAAPALISYPSDRSPASAPSNIPGPANFGASINTGQPAAPLAQFFDSAQLGSGNGMPTDFGFAGQRYDSSTGLIHMGVRYYDPSLGRFISPDPIVPEPGNPQALNRYTYAYNNPLRFVDPSGFDPLDAAWESEFEAFHHRPPTWQDRLVRLFSISFPGEWNWSNFYNSDGSYIEGSLERFLRDQRPSDRTWASMPGAMERLAGWYEADETEMFVRDMGTLFAGLPDRFDSSMHVAVTGCQEGYSCDDRLPLPTHIWVYLGPEGLPVYLTGARDEDANVHHWAWAFALGYHEGGPLAVAMNTQREFEQAGGIMQAYGNPESSADIWLGNRGALMGCDVRTFGASPSTIIRLWRHNVLLQWP